VRKRRRGCESPATSDDDDPARKRARQEVANNTTWEAPLRRQSVYALVHALIQHVERVAGGAPFRSFVDLIAHFDGNAAEELAVDPDDVEAAVYMEANPPETAQALFAWMCGRNPRLGVGDFHGDPRTSVAFCNALVATVHSINTGAIIVRGWALLFADYIVVATDEVTVDDEDVTFLRVSDVFPAGG
jgi:hypothetical protein